MRKKKCAIEREHVSHHKKDWVIGLSIAGGLFMLTLIMIVFSSRRSSGSSVSLSGGGSKIAVVEVEGAIYDSEKTVRQFKKYGDDKSIKAIVFRINSPGGVVGPSQEIYEAAKRVRDAGKPVIVSMGNVAASGGYMIACASDTIMAAPGTTTGSIGVIVEIMNLKKLYDKIGVKFETITVGKYKGTGANYRDLTEEDRAYLQSWIDDSYDQFIHLVAKERGMTLGDVKKVADGRVFTGRQALALGLVDTLGYYEDAINLAAKMAGIEGEPSVIKERKKEYSIYDVIFGKAGIRFPGFHQTRLAYLWQ